MQERLAIREAHEDLHQSSTAPPPQPPALAAIVGSLDAHRLIESNETEQVWLGLVGTCVDQQLPVKVEEVPSNMPTSPPTETSCVLCLVQNPQGLSKLIASFLCSYLLCYTVLDKQKGPTPILLGFKLRMETETWAQISQTILL